MTPQILQLLLLCATLSSPVEIQQGPEPPVVDHHRDLALPGLSRLIAIAEEHRPELRQRGYLVDAARGDALQSGLYPNPFVAYTGDEIGGEGSAGQQGIEISQTVVTAGKLRRASEFFGRVAQFRRVELERARWEIRREVAEAFVAYVGATADEQLLARLVEIAHQQVQAVQTLLDQGAATRPELLQAQIEYHQARAEHEAARVRTEQARKGLAATVGVVETDLPVLADIDLGKLDLDYDAESLRRIVLTELPSLRLVDAAIEAARARYELELARAYPDLVIAGGTAYDDASSDAIASVSVGINLPVFDRNQGAILASRARLAAVETTKDVVLLSANRSFIKAWAEYAAARERAKMYEQNVVAQAEENLELVREAYARGQVDFLTLLVAQRTLFSVQRQLLQLRITALEALVRLRYLEPPDVSLP